MLRFGNNYIINIELKNKKSKSKIEKQLKQNRDYLRFMNKRVFYFCYVSENNLLYQLIDDDLKSVSLNILKCVLNRQSVIKNIDIDSLFKPSDYLVSPFNSTDKFLAEQYFLTSHQETIKKNVIKWINTPAVGHYTAINGSAGTGKTLLIYDIARNLMNAKMSVLLIHCGKLNDGHDNLIEIGWSIKDIKNFVKNEKININGYDVIIIDEAQRMWFNQFEDFIQKIKKSNCKCVFSYDEAQVLSDFEVENATFYKIKALPNIKSHELTNKIRTNKEVSAFIRGVFNYKKNEPILNCGNVSFDYYSSIIDMLIAMHNLKESGWEILQLTPNISHYKKASHEIYLNNTSQKSHDVIGQEFDNVVVIVDQHFRYKDNGELDYFANSHYLADKMLFQNMTRTRNKLKILILNNPVILDRCLTLLTPRKSQ